MILSGSRIDDPQRLAALHATGLLDSVAEDSFDRLTRIATRTLGVPVSLVSLVDRDRQFFKSSIGLAEPWASSRQTPLSHSFCRHVVESDTPLVVEDAKLHPLVRDNPAIAELGVIAYAGTPLRTLDGDVLGSVCAIDHRPHPWSPDDLQVLDDLAALVAAEIELRTSARKLRIAEAEVRLLHEIGEAVAAADDTRESYLVALERLCATTGWRYGEVWLPSADGGRLEQGPVWCDVEDDLLVAFARARRERTFAPGEGLPGRAWTERGTVRGSPLPVGEFHLQDGLSIPVASAAEAPLAVLSFYSPEPHPHPTGHAELLTTAAGHLREVVCRKITESALRESERRFRGALETVRAPAVTLDLNGCVTFANDHLLALTQWTRKEARGKEWVGPFVEPGGALLPPFSEEVPPHHEDVLLVRDGTQRRIAWDNTVLLDAEGQPAGIASIGRDVTEQRRLERLKNELIALVSHELRTPLTAIRGAVQLLRARATGLAPREGELLEMACRNADRLLRLTNDLLDIERAESGSAALHRRAWPVGVLVGDAVATLQPAADAAEVRLVTDVPEPETAVFADDTRVLQVLTNLLANAVKFSTAGGEIQVGALASRGEVVFFVRDQGRGIPGDKLESIFARFEQVEPTDAREKGGAGLGLAIARALVTQHGGRIWAESTPGEGSTFRFTLPLAEASANGG